MSRKWLLMILLSAAAVAVPVYAYTCSDTCCSICDSGSCPLPCP